MSKYQTLANQASIDKTIAALKSKGFEAVHVADAKAALAAAKGFIPTGSEVFTMSSITLETIGANTEFNNAASYKPVRDKLYALNQATQGREMSRIGSAPDVAVGSVHAVTESGSLMIASMTGSQLAAYASGSATVVFVIGAQKIVKDLDSGFTRINDYVLGLESVRARKAYGLPDTFNSAVNKLLIINAEVNPTRIKVIIVDEVLGF